jgi:formate dehydrogenase maturation protein FdhE
MGIRMETTTKKQALLKIIYQKLEQAYEDTLEDVIELLDIRSSEDEEDIRAFEDTKNEPTIILVGWVK